MNNALAKLAAMATVPAVPQIARAADEIAKLPATPTLGGAELFNLGSSLVVVILAIIVVGWLYSRMQRMGHRGSDVINIVASHPLGPKERILLIEIAEQQLLVGMTASQVQTLHVFEQPVVTAPRLPDSPSSESAGFAQRLRTAVKEFAK